MSKKECIRMGVIAVIMILIVIITILAIKIIGNGDISNLIGGKTNQITTKAKLEQNNWDYDIVTNITTENVPIPARFTYVSGNIQTGTIIEDDNGSYYLWIPYEENVSANISEYYQNAESYYEMESDAMDSIKKYKGFYVALNMNVELEDLKTIGNEEYKNYEEQLGLLENGETVYSHVLYKEEIEQIVNFLDKNEFNIADNTIGIEAIVINKYSTVKASVETDNTEKVGNRTEEITKLATTDEDVSINAGENGDSSENVVEDENSSENVVENNSENVVEDENNSEGEAEIDATQDWVFMLKSTTYPNGVPIPKGYKYSNTDGIISIQDENNSNLIYIWVPLSAEELLNRKDELESLYKNYTNKDGEKFKTDENSELHKVFNTTTEELPEEFVKSITQYGGFYISEAELGFDSSNNYYNKARGMVGWTVTNTRYGGNYYRGTAIEGLTYDKMKEIAADVSANNTAVVSHLMYGVEYDAAVLWIKNTNESYQDNKGNDITTALIANSTYVGKYTNSELGATANAERSSAYFNGIWGLGGNLSEVTQEKSGNSYVIRGGDWSTTGEDTPIASRNITDNISTDAIGFRTCLYITPDLPKATYNPNEYTSTQEDDTLFYIDNLTFEIWEETTRYVCSWDGLNIYRDPDTSSDVIQTLGFANVVTVTGKAKQDSKDNEGNTVCWARVKLSDGNSGFLNAKRLTKETTTVENLKFVVEGKATRYHGKNLHIYSKPNPQASTIKSLDFSGKIEVIGKSIDLVWAMVNIDGEIGYVRANELRLNANTEQIGNYTFIIGDPVQRILYNKDGAKVYNNPGDTQEADTIKDRLEVTMDAVTEDGKLARIKCPNGSVVFTTTDNLLLPGPTLEVSINLETGIVTVKAYDKGRGVEAIYNNSEKLKSKSTTDNNGTLYCEATFQAYKDGEYEITAEDSEGNISIYGKLDTSRIKVEDPSKTPVETTPTTPADNGGGSTGGGSTGGGSTGGSTENDTIGPKVVDALYSYSNATFAAFKDGDTLDFTKTGNYEYIYIWLEVSDNMCSGKDIYAYLTNGKGGSRISGKITTTEGSGNYKGKYYIAYKVTSSGTYTFQICDGSNYSPYTYFAVTVKLPGGSSGGSTDNSSKPKIYRIYTVGKKIYVQSSDDTQYINYRLVGDTWQYLKRTGTTTSFTVSRYATYEICAGKYDSNGNALYSNIETVTTKSDSSVGSDSGEDSGGDSNSGSDSNPNTGDTTKPTIQYFAQSSRSWTKSDVKITVKAYDAYGIKDIKVNGRSTTFIYNNNPNKCTATLEYTATSKGEYTIDVIDFSGNTTTIRANVLIDKTGPRIEYKYNGYELGRRIRI